MAYPKVKQAKAAKAKRSVVKGKFPINRAVDSKLVIYKVNWGLACVLFGMVVLSMLSYLGVILKENKIKGLHSETNKVNYENIELQNRVDYLKSFYALDDKVQKIDFLKKADKVLEVENNNNIQLPIENKSFFDKMSVPGF